ncbi:MULTISPECIES: epoxide hydrolase family protein [Chryseobacterium]|uniref:Pimeloyl-ACP methyl ester carboxylesterase n=1 Tax=Chryseobacterium camelliae TaxID=1265445 RepID=A0ABU0TKP8_9FLAO|nr:MULTISPECIES: epoxide hydrolase family protein [Chryseobacterium]MDT3408531.1 pimeloyl-ACP methyl ester carboxylesterase [Pseudacidovorax intermedius]MDQ1097614.1 pimeloyl-ACP methyl ester carboxylesterase [Chryseobacterium camelliae]MDQ1101543.1 pimeloyl-ACP methyl ester carboxylesterase [Chryseobacterium sp. SORGH_AS_1048]MDR6084986.1 pimeloyl-ACP methyl ester carboxylesterase [Chryseobacterium sp. SORGH_AS_0909]MDR6129340.1 pimeloyl-ACP methyl ester carboxylesterase [Chryseobacterium sp.
MEKFEINVPESELTELQWRLKQTRWTDEPLNAGWDYGTNPEYLKILVDYWRNGYDWRKQELLLNQFPQFIAEIKGIKIHFLYIKGKSKNSKPLILTHGWPDSFYRFYKVIPMLTNPGSTGDYPDVSFDLVIPSIPGFGFSEKIAVNTDETAAIWARLMTEVLGYNHFFAAGGDLGTPITKSLANQFPECVKAIHLTDVGYPTGEEDWSQMSAAEQAFGRFIQNWWYTEGAYNMIQSTKPQTLGYALNDSPVGLASWIIEKFNSWSDHRGHIENTFTKDELITNIMIYWITQTINTSIRTYAEDARTSWMGGLRSQKRVEAPTGVSVFHAEAPIPEEWANRMANVTYFKRLDTGGHFAPMEQPELWTSEIKNFFYPKE